MRSLFLSILLILSFLGAVFSQNDVSKVPQEADSQSEELELSPLRINPIVVRAKGFDRRKHWRLIRSVKRVYPLAKVAQEKLRAMEKTLDTLDDKKQRRKHVKEVYRQIKAEYTPILLKMTQRDGRVLVRLIDRETDYTAYEVVDEFKGGLVASFWQGIGRLFGQNLKSEYGSTKEDKIIEQIIVLYEAGRL